MAPRSGMVEAAAVHELTRRSAHDASVEMACIEVILPAVATIVTAARLYLRHRFKIALGWDDWFIAASIPLTWAIWSTWYYMVAHVVKDRISDMSSSSYAQFFRFSFANVEISVFTITVIKLSVLVFYMRAFATTRKVRIWIYIVAFLNIAWGFARFVFILSYCTPVSNFWNDPASCTGGDMSDFAKGASVSGIVVELAILVLPVPILWKLHLPLRQRVGILLLFSLGAVVVACNAMRAVYMFSAPNMQAIFLDDHTTSMLGFWQHMETNIGILAADLPAMHSPLRSVIQGWTGRFKKEAKQDTSPSPSLPAVETPLSFKSMDIDSKAVGSITISHWDGHV